MQTVLEQGMEAIRQQRMAILEKLRGKYIGTSGGSEEFTVQKEEEKAREIR